MEQVIIKVTEVGRNKLVKYIRAYIYGAAARRQKCFDLHETLSSIHNQIRQPSWDFKIPEDLCLSIHQVKTLKRSTGFPWLIEYTSKNVVDYIKYITEHYERI